MADQNKTNIFSKILNLGDASLELALAKAKASAFETEQYIAKARSEIAEQEDDALWRKSIYRDLNYTTSSQGYLDRGSKIGFQHLRAMAAKNTIVAAIIQTRQNQVASCSTFVQETSTLGFQIKRNNEDEELEKIKKELFGEEPDVKEKIKQKQNTQSPIEDSGDNSDVLGSEEAVQKAEGDQEELAPENDDSDELPENQPPTDGIELGPDAFNSKENESEPEMSDREKDRLAKEELRKRDQKKIRAIGKFIEQCGDLEGRAFEDTKWDFDAYLRAIVRDTLTCDLISTEIINDDGQRPHHFVPVDSTTIRFTTPEISDYRKFDLTSNYDILYPEKELEGLMETTDAFHPDEEKLQEFDYKYAQIAKGKIERLFTPEEMCVTQRNPTTDIYSNGYSVSELELLVGTVTSHIFTENYNHSYFTQGFSAKGILHVKAPLNRRKLETLRIQWKHMVSGAKNSFQTPIMSGMDEVQWIPLTQNHSDMEFSNWMNYLIKVICGIYQIDPAEIGFGMRDEGGQGGGINGDNTEQKMEQSKDKGLKPLLKHIAKYLNKNIVHRIDPNFDLEFVGMADESPTAHVDRLAKEVKIFKSVNDIREEQGRPPIEGADDWILDPTYFQYYSQFHPEGQKLAEKNQIMQAAMQPPQDENAPPGEGQPDDGSGAPPPFQKSFKKSSSWKPVVIEYYLPK